MIMQRFLALIAGLCFAVAGYAQTETITYLHTDHLGSPVMARDAQGNTLWTDTYDPWGLRLDAPTANDADVSYTGHFEETDIGLTYAQARWYDPEIGRFLSPDSVEFHVRGPNHFGRYEYGLNNPIGNWDPDGRAAAAAAPIGAAIACSRAPSCVRAVGSVIAGGIGFVSGLVFNESSEGGAKDADSAPQDADADEWLYGPEDDPKVNPDGSTNGDTWTTPDDYASAEEAQDRLDPFKPMDGRRRARIPQGTDVKRGKTPGGEGPYNGSGGANETLIEGGLPAGSVGPWEPL